MEGIPRPISNPIIGCSLCATPLNWFGSIGLTAPCEVRVLAPSLIFVLADDGLQASEETATASPEVNGHNLRGTFRRKPNKSFAKQLHNNAY